MKTEKSAHPPITKNRGRWLKGRTIRGPQGSCLVATVYSRAQPRMMTRNGGYTRTEYRIDIELTITPRRRVHQIFSDTSKAAAEAETWMRGFAAAQGHYKVSILGPCKVCNRLHGHVITCPVGLGVMPDVRHEEAVR